MKAFIICLVLAFTVSVQAQTVKASSMLTGSSVLVADNTAKTNTTIGVSYLSPRGVATTNAAALGWIQTATALPKAGGAVSDNTSITAVVTALDAKGTNTATIVFERSADGTYWDSAHVFSVAFGPATTTGLVTTTNVPTTFLTGTRYVRIKTITNDDVGGNSTNYVTSVTFNQPQ